jgi:hypothetical protein
MTQEFRGVFPTTGFLLFGNGPRSSSLPGMAGEISTHSFYISMILSRVQSIGCPVPILLVPVIPEMDFSNFFRATVLYVRRVLFESRSPLESEDAFLH